MIHDTMPQLKHPRCVLPEVYDYLQCTDTREMDTEGKLLNFTKNFALSKDGLGRRDGVASQNANRS